MPNRRVEPLVNRSQLETNMASEVEEYDGGMELNSVDDGEDDGDEG